MNYRAINLALAAYTLIWLAFTTTVLLAIGAIG